MVKRSGSVAAYWDAFCDNIDIMMDMRDFYFNKFKLIYLTIFFTDSIPLAMLIILPFFLVFSKVKSSHYKQRVASFSKQIFSLLQDAYRPIITLFGIGICWSDFVIFKRTLLIVVHTYVQSSFRSVDFPNVCIVSGIYSCTSFFDMASC